MSLLSRILGRTTIVAPIVPDDSHLKTELKTAKRENSLAVSSFVEATQKQSRDAVMARRVIREVLNRADRVRTNYHATIQK